MANALLLEEYRLKSGKSKTFLAKRLSVSRPTIYYLLDHPENCTYQQAELLSNEVGITKKTDKSEIFLP